MSLRRLAAGVHQVGQVEFIDLLEETHTDFWADQRQLLEDAAGALQLLHEIVTGMPGAWAEDAACRGMSVDLFFPERGQNHAEAMATCARCPVRTECAEHALSHPANAGYLAGLSTRARARLRRTQEADAA